MNGDRRATVNKRGRRPDRFQPLALVDLVNKINARVWRRLGGSSSSRDPKRPNDIPRWVGTGSPAATASFFTQ